MAVSWEPQALDNLTWVADWETLNFNFGNFCYLIADIVAICTFSVNSPDDSYYCSSLRRSFLSSKVAPTVTALIRLALPSDVPSPTNGQIVDWFQAIVNGRRGNSQVEENWDQFKTKLLSKSKCSLDLVCPALEWEGNPDISGVGVFASYFVEAILLTLYLTFITLDNLYRRGKTGSSGKFAIPTKSPWDRILNAIRASVSTFLDGTLVFSLAMLAAAIWIKSRGYYPTRHEEFTSLIIAAFSSLPAYLLFLVDIQNTRRKYLRIAALTVIYALLLAEGKASENPNTGTAYETLCISLDDILNFLLTTHAQVKKGLAIAFPIPIAFWCLQLAIERLSPPWFRDHKANILLPMLKILRILHGIYLFLIMWLLLAAFGIWRDRLLSRSGERTENKWGFGQILALSTWIPVIVEFVYSLCFGVHKGLRGRLPWPFQPTHRRTIPKKSSHDELLQRAAEESGESDQEEQESIQLQLRAIV